MCERYDDILDAFHQVTNDVHAGHSAAAAIKRIRPWVTSRILQVDRAAVLAKLDTAARLVEEQEAELRAEQLAIGQQEGACNGLFEH